jgi:integrase/recombinase XerC
MEPTAHSVHTPRDEAADALSPLDVAEAGTALRAANTGAALDGVIAAWLDSKLTRSNAQRTHDTYATHMASFRAALAQVGLDLASERRAVALIAQAWAKQSVRGRVLRPATIAQRLASVASFYNFVLKRGLLDLPGNPIAVLERPRVEGYAEAQALDLPAVRRQLAAIDRAKPTGVRDYALLRVALTTGRRLAELAGLRWGAVALHGSSVTLTWTRAKGGKVARDTLAAGVGADLLTWLDRHYGAARGGLPADAPVWVNLSYGGRGQRGGPGAALSTQAIDDIVRRRLHTHPHALRHTFAAAMEGSGAKVSEIQARLGHSSLATTGRYLAALHKAENPYAERLADLFASP